MLQMHHRLAGMQLGQVADQRVGIDGATVVLTAARDALAQQIAFANQRPVAQGVDKTVLGGANHQVTAVSGRFAQAQDALRRHLNASQQLT